MNISEDTFAFWAKGPSATETEKCGNAETAVRKAMAADEKLSALSVSVFAQGSYRARTNVRQDSDVDICVCYNDAFFPKYPDGKTSTDFGNRDSGLSFADYKNLVQSALESYFGRTSVTRGNKAFDVHANTYRIDADVVPTFKHRRYTGQNDSDGSHQYYVGVAFNPDNGAQIINWPDQTYVNGVSRNDETARRYKRLVRIFKQLRNKMQDDKIPQASNIASFLIECLMWNAPLTAFQGERYTDNVRQVIIDLWNSTQKDEDCSKWVEVNRLKWLFRSTQPWTRDQANKFLHAAWNYVGFK